MTKSTSISCVADIHGSDVCWRKFLNAAKFYGADTIIVGGDVTGKVLVPLVQRSDGRVEANIAGRVQAARSEDAIAEMEARIRFNGFYPYRCDESAYEELQANPTQRDAIFRSVMADTLRSWLRLADERLRGTGIRAFVMPGNDDDWYVDDVLAESGEVVNCDGRIIDLGEYQVLGFGPSNRTPWNTYRELDEPDIASQLDDLALQVDPAKPLVLVTHVPPYGTGIDSAPQLREDLSVVTSGGAPVMIPVGSAAVRAFIERTQPMLSLHGHIHESRGVTRIGRTVVLNPGSAYSSGSLYGALVSTRQGKVLSQQLVTG